MAQQIIIEVPGTKISELERTSKVTAEDVLPVVQGEATKQAPLEQVAELVKSGLGSAALKEANDFATPATVAAVDTAAKQRNDATNERVDSVEYGLTAISNGADASFNTYAEMLSYVPAKPNVSVRVNADADNSKNGTYTWNGSVYKKGYDALDASKTYTDEQVIESLTESKDFTKINIQEIKDLTLTLPYASMQVPQFGTISTSGNLVAGQIATYILAKPASTQIVIRAIRLLSTAKDGEVTVKVFTKTNSTFNLVRTVKKLTVQNIGLNEFFDEPFVLNANEYIGFSTNKFGIFGYVAKTLADVSYYSATNQNATTIEDSAAGKAAVLQIGFYDTSDISKIGLNVNKIDQNAKLNFRHFDQLFETVKVGLHTAPATSTNNMNAGQWIPNNSVSAAGIVRRFRTFSSVAGFVRVGTYTKNDLKFKRNNYVDVYVTAGFNEIDISIEIKAGDYVGIQTFNVGMSCWLIQSSGHDGIYSSTGTTDEETYSASANYSYAFQFNFDVSLNKTLVDTTKKWSGKDYVVCGDSIDWYDGHAYFPSQNDAGQIAIGYQSHVKAALGCNVINLAQSGWTMPQILDGQIKTYDFSNTYALSIKAGANDQKNKVELGQVIEIGGKFNTTTYAGALQAAVEFVINANKLTKIFLFTPIRGWYSAATANNLPQDNEFYGLRYISEKFADVVKQIGKLYGLPIIDLYNEAGFNDLNASTFYGDNEQTVTELYRLHVNQLGYQRMAEVIIPQMSKH